MGCFFGCFRIKDDRSRTHLVSHSARSKLNEPVISGNRLSALFLSEGREESRCNQKDHLCTGSPEIEKDLKLEAKFLKACGTLPETPAEIRRASEKLKNSPVHDKGLYSWMPNASAKKLQMDKQPHEPPTPIKLFEERGNLSDSLEHTPGSYVSNTQNTVLVSISSIEGSERGSDSTTSDVHPSQFDNTTTSSPLCLSANTEQNMKSVRFECDFDVSSSKGSTSGDSSYNSGNPEGQGNQSVSKPSPKPTPLKLSDEMQTPGTVFPANLDSFPNGKTRIRSQFVYSVPNTFENVSRLDVLKEEESVSYQLSDGQPESLNKLEKEVSLTSVQKELNVEACSSSQLNPQPSIYGDNNQNPSTSSSKYIHYRKTPGDRPIIGMVAAHWNEDETSRISPKWWDGNGIPNSTNKYKEDQKVSWHATPFEERLEKALSEESFISQRKHVNGVPIIFDENEETDTALSKLQPSTHSKSVVSC